MPIKEKIIPFLHSFQEPNYALLVELVAGAKAIPTCASELLVVHYFSNNPLTKARAKELLLQLQHPVLTTFLEREEYLILEGKHPYYSVSQEEKLQQKLQQLAAIPILSMGSISLAIALYHQQALGWALDEATPQQQHEILTKLLSGKSIFYLNKNNPLSSFPVGLTQFEQLTHLTFFIQGTAKNFIIPTSLKNCQQLKALHLYGGVVQEFPLSVFQQMPNLKSVHFNSQQKMDIATLQKNIPHCQFNIEVV